jgi:FkbM family methyltransferase
MLIGQIQTLKCMSATGYIPLWVGLIPLMLKRPDMGGPLTAVSAQLAMGAGIVRYVWGHPANSGRRVRAVLAAAQYQVQARLLRRRSMARLGERSRLWVDLHRTGASKALYANPPDLPEMLVWRRALRDGSLFVDVGANVGTYTIWAAELGAEVIAIEPAADTFALLQENIALNGYPVTAVQAAAGDHCGTARFTAGLDAGNSLSPNGPVVTELVTIDALIGDRPVSGMKIDVEGFEIDVLRGAARALADHRIDLIQIEWNEMSTVSLGTDRGPIAELLAVHGYRLHRPDATGRLIPVAEPGFGADVFAIPAQQDASSITTPV